MNLKESGIPPRNQGFLIPSKPYKTNGKSMILSYSGVPPSIHHMEAHQKTKKT